MFKVQKYGFYPIYLLFLHVIHLKKLVIQKTLYIFRLIALSIIALLLAVIISLQLPQVQTFVAKIATSKISKQLDGNINIEKIHIRPFTTAIIKNISVTDKSSPVNIDTLFKAEYIIASFSFKSLFQQSGIGFKKAIIRNGLMHLTIENSGNDDTNNLSRIFGLESSEKEDEPGKDVFNIDNVLIENFRFRLSNFTSEPEEVEEGINWDDLDVRKINIEASDMRFSDMIMYGHLRKMSFVEKSGYVCHNVSGNARVGRGETYVEDFRISDPWSNLDLKTYSMKYENTEAFSDFITKVRVSSQIRFSTIDFRTISYFAGEYLSDMVLNFRGEVDGTVSDINTKNLYIETLEKNIYGTLSARVSGLPEVTQMDLDIKFNNLIFNTTGIENIIKDWAPTTAVEIKKFATNTDFALSGTLSGPINDANLASKISSEIGYIDTDIKISNLLNTEKNLGIGGKVKTENLDIGKIIMTDIIRQCSLESELYTELGKDETTLDLKSLKVSRLNLNDYNYTNIAGKGEISKNQFDGRIICNDPSLNFMFQGLFSLSSRTNNSLYRFYANVGYADLHAMNIDKRKVSKVSFSTNANFNHINSTDILGSISINNLMLDGLEGKHNIGDIKIGSHSNDNIFRLNISSGFINGRFVGSSSINQFISDIRGVNLDRETPSLVKSENYRWKGDNYSLSLDITKPNAILDFLVPGLYIAENTKIDINIDSLGLMDAGIASQRLAFKENYIKDLELNITNRDSILKANILSTEIKAGGLIFNNNNIDLSAKDDFATLEYKYNNEKVKGGKGTLSLNSRFSLRNDVTEYEIGINPSEIQQNNNTWKIRPSKIFKNKDGIYIENFGIDNNGQKISLAGGISKSQSDTLRLNLDKFNIGVLNSILSSDLGLNGKLSGDAKLISSASSKGILLDIVCDSTQIGGSDIGNLYGKSIWNHEFKRFDINVSTILDQIKTLDISGNYSPSINRLETSIKLNKLNPSFAKIFLTDIFDQIEGELSGEINAEGPLNALKISTKNTRLDKGLIRVEFTRVPYNVMGDFSMDENGVYFDNMNIFDRYNNPGKITGSINYNNFYNLSLATRIDVNGMESMNIREADDLGFYGNIFSTGRVEINGEINNILMTVNARSTGSGNLHIPLTSASTASTTNLLKFTEHINTEDIDPYEALIQRQKSKESSSSNFAIRIRATATPGVEAHIEIDKENGNVLSGRGNGLIDLNIDTAEDIFDIKGDYTISSGNYKFVALGLAARDFAINPGSTIKFNGDIMESILDIDARYITKASLATLIADTASVRSRRPVDCGISIKDKLYNPRLEFSIDIPDLDPMIKSRVESALSTQDKIQKQFLSLIISNSFLPDEQSGIVNNSSVLYSNVSEIMANQLNTIFERLDIPLDLGLNYQPNEKGNDIFDVAISTQLFNNRLIVNGNIGNRQYTSSSNSSTDVVGDIDLELKLDRMGALRLNLFSHSADQYTSYLDNSQRSGIGITYQQEYSNFVDFVRRIFMRKEKKEKLKMLEQEALLNEEKKIISIKAEDYK